MLEKKCSLCTVNLANKTGSHIFSWFLIRDAVNNLGSKRRRNEIAFEISSSTFIQTYFGSEILPDKIKEIKGKELDDDEVSKLVDPFTRDYILCSKCEEKFSVLESIVSDRIFSHLRAHAVKVGVNVEALHLKENTLLRLFVYSLAWRADIVGFNNFQLDAKHKEALRKILDENLDIDKAKLLENIAANKIEISRYPLIVTFLETKGENTNAIFCSFSQRPYWMIINDFSFQLFFKEKHAKHFEEFAFGINGAIKKKDYINCNEDKFKIAVISDEKRQQINARLYTFIAIKIIRRATILFREGFKKIFGYTAPQGIVNYFVSEVTQNNDHVVEKYTPEHFTIVARDVMLEYMQQIAKLYSRYPRY